jgi:uncharacterized SAM-binding protein YcdF (DUF218 family)
MGYCGERLHTTDRSSHRLSRLRAWLSPADPPNSAELIFVLAGRVHRKQYALELFRQGLAPRLLFSVGRFEIRRFSKMSLPAPLDLLKMAQEVPPPKRHYFVFFDSQDQDVHVEHVLPGRFGTLTEIAALGRWLDANPAVRSVLVISSAGHLRRVRMCCRLLKADMKLAYLASPVSLQKLSAPETAGVSGEQYLPDESVDPPSLREDLQELFKLAIYWVLLKLR